jgi:hypothetical protein
MPQEQAVQAYTGSHWRVEAAVLAEIDYYTKFAVRAHLSLLLSLVWNSLSWYHRCDFLCGCGLLWLCTRKIHISSRQPYLSSLYVAA